MGAIRLFLAITVVLSHTQWMEGMAFIGGENAVQLFYMISGFLIAAVLSSGRYTSISSFYLNRVLRLFPIYYIVLGLSLIANLMAGHKFFSIFDDFAPQSKIVVVLSNILIFGQDWLFFISRHAGGFEFLADYKSSDDILVKGLLVPQAWTLGLELTFYLLAPFVLHSIPRMLTLLFGSLAIHIILATNGRAGIDPWSYRFFPAELSYFLLGAFSWRFLLPKVKALRHREGPSVLVCVATCLSFISYSILYSWLPATAIVKSTFLVASFWVALPFVFLLGQRGGLDSRLGELSYPLYISHVLVILMTERLVFRSFVVSSGVQAAAYLVSSLAFAFVLYLTVGLSVEKVRSRIRKGADLNGPIDHSVSRITVGAMK